MSLKVTKSDLLNIARGRNLPETNGALKKLSIDDLMEKLGELHMTELDTIAKQIEARKAYDGTPLEDLKKLARQRGVAVSGTRAELIDRLLTTTDDDAIPTSLDDSQSVILAHASDAVQIINAGPGSGKTTTMAHLVALASKTSDMRILALMYNRNARNAFKIKLKGLGVKVTPKQHLTKSAGIFVVTFDEYVYHTRVAGTLSSFLSSFRETYEYGLSMPRKSSEWYHYLIVDEAQDLLPNHVQLVNQLRPWSYHVVIAGDPRQEIYMGSGWFSKLWRKTPDKYRRTLKYNHRSTPEIVTLINDFSRVHFPDLHYDQVPSSRKEGEIKFVVTDRRAGAYVAQMMVKYNELSCYCISPVTIRKFSAGKHITTLRQIVYDHYPGRTLFIADETNKVDINIPGWAVGNSYSFKGTEREHVYTILSDIEYQNYGISRTNALKLVYVAISRARSRLEIVLNQQVHPESYWWNIAPQEILTEIPNPAPPLYVRDFISVTDLSEMEAWGIHNGERLIKSPPLSIETKNDADFVGIFAENHLATQLGVTNDFNYVFRPAKHKGSILEEATGIFVEGDKFVVVYNSSKIGENKLQSILEQQHTAQHPEYFRAVIDKTLDTEAVDLWTVSERLLNYHPDVSAHAEVVKTITNSSSFRQGVKVQHTITCHRSKEIVGSIGGVADIVADNHVIEIKYCNQLLPQYYNQSRIYGSILGKTPIIYNLKTGDVLKVNPLELTVLNDVARAVLILKTATVASQRLPHRVKHSPQTAVYISVDLEYIGDIIYEVGAVAYQPSTDRVFGRYHRVWSGTRSVYQDDNHREENDNHREENDNQQADDGIEGVACMPGKSFEQLTGLQFNSDTQIPDLMYDQKQIRLEFNRWVDSITSTPTFVYWGATDKDLALLGVDNNPKVNAMMIFRAWLDNTKQGRTSNYSLSDAVRQCFCEVPFHPHRAYEDAVLTASVLTAVTNPE